MPTRQSTVDYLLDQLHTLTSISARKMFGEYALYLDGKVVALVCDDQLFVKPTDAGKAYLQGIDEQPPYPGAKCYFRISGDRWEDDEWLSQLLKVTADELPLPKKKG